MRGEELARVRFERHHGGSNPACVSCLAQRIQNRLMPQVHAIEVADGKGVPRSWMLRTCRGNAALNEHGRCGGPRLGDGGAVVRQGFATRKAFNYNDLCTANRGFQRVRTVQSCR